MTDAIIAKIKAFNEITECLEALEFIRDNPELLKKEAIDYLKNERDRRLKDDPVIDMISHHLRLLEVLRVLFGKFKALSLTPSSLHSVDKTEHR